MQETRAAQGATVAGSLVSTLLRHARRHGVAVAPLLRCLGVAEPELSLPDARVARRAYHEAFELAASLAGASDFGLRCGASAELDGFHVVARVVVGQETVRHALERLVALHRLLDEAAASSLERDGDTVTLVTEESSLHHPRPRHAAEFAVASFVTLMRAHTCGRFSPTAIRFMHPPPGSCAEHRRVLGVAPVFGCQRTEITVEARQLELPCGSGQRGLVRHLERYADERAEALRDADFTSRVERTVRARLSSGPPSIRATAAAVGMSPRTLQRRLKQTDDSFQSLVDRVRRADVRRYLARDDLSLDEVAALLSFKDTRSLRRATLRWFGLSPSALRREPGDGRGEAT